MNADNAAKDRIAAALTRFVDDMPIWSKEQIMSLFSSPQEISVTLENLENIIRSLETEHVAYFIGREDAYVCAHEELAKSKLTGYVLDAVLRKISSVVSSS